MRIVKPIFLVLALSLAAFKIRANYCHRICHSGCDNFYNHAGIEPKSVPDAMRRCVVTCKSDKCSDPFVRVVPRKNTKPL